MVRGFVYSLSAIVLFIFGSIAWMMMQSPDEDTLVLYGGWMILISLFAVGPVFFALGYWHQRQLYPAKSHWDPELGE